MRNIYFAGGLAVSTILLLTVIFATSMFSIGAFAANVNPNVTNGTSFAALGGEMVTLVSAPVQERNNYTIFLPAMTWNESSLRPTLIRSGYAEIMHFTKDPFVDFTPDGMFFPAYSFAFNITNVSNYSNNFVPRVALYIRENQSYAHLENATQTLALFSESQFSFVSFESNTTINQNFRFPCPFIFAETCGQQGSNLTIFVRNSSADWVIKYDLATDKFFNVSLFTQTMPNTEFNPPQTQFFNLTIVFTNWTPATNWTAVNLTYGLIDPRVLAAVRPGSQDRPNFMTAPITILSQSSSGFDEENPMEPGVNSTVQIVANLYNNLTNYTLNNVMARFPFPWRVNVTFDSAIQNPFKPSENVTFFTMYPVSVINLTASCAGMNGPTGVATSLMNVSINQNGPNVNLIAPSGYPVNPSVSAAFFAFPVNYTNKSMGFVDTGKHGQHGGKERGGFGGGKAQNMTINVSLMDIYVNISAIGCANASADGFSAARTNWNYSTNASISFTATMSVPKFSEEFKNASTTSNQTVYANRTVYLTSDNQATKFSNTTLPDWNRRMNETINVTYDGANVPPCGSAEANITNANGGGNTCWVESGSVTVQGLGTGSHSISVGYTSQAAAAATTTTTTSSSVSGGSAVAGPVFKTTITTITSGETKTVNPGDTAGFSGMDILTTETVNNVKLDVGKMTTAPAEVTTPLEGTVNYYVQVNTTGISDTQLSSVKLRFKVTKAWLTDKGVSADDIVLWRFNSGKWTELTTTKTTEGDTTVSYEATSPGLSTFAVATKSTSVTAPTAPGEPTAPTGEEEKKEEVPVTPNILILAAIVIIIIIGAVWYTQKKK